MSKWLNGRIQGRPNIERSLYANEEAAIDGLSKVIRRHRDLGRRQRDAWRGAKYVCEILDEDGQVIAVYWLSDEEDSPEPQ